MMGETMTHEARTRTGKKPAPRRMCAGCGKRGPASELVRVVLDPTGAAPTVAVDVGGSAFGHGAHVHPSPDCLARALKGGFSKAFKTNVVANVEDVVSQIIVGVDRRIEGLVMGARRARHVVVGADATAEAWREGKVALLIVATDAAAAAQLSSVRDAVAAGKAIAWSVKGRLGALLGRDEVAVCGIVHDKVADAIGTAYRMSGPFKAGSRSGGAWSSSEVR
jgi:predicted RNA-binding protein YlxR (DUF448 family)/ribosomal protein L7Ae-like RNA K-turn-binding protein